MPDLGSGPREPGWFTKYVVVAGAAVILSGMTFFLTGYQNFVTKTELEALFPYPYDKPIIIGHIRDSEIVLQTVNKSLTHLNERISQVNYEHLLRIQRLEDIANHDLHKKSLADNPILKGDTH